MGKDDRVLSPSPLAQMAVNEMRHMAQRLSHELGKPVLTYAANRVEGVYARRIDLAQGRVALIMGERSAHIVPWRPALERFAGRQVEGLMRGESTVVEPVARIGDCSATNVIREHPTRNLVRGRWVGLE